MRRIGSFFLVMALATACGGSSNSDDDTTSDNTGDESADATPDSSTDDAGDDNIDIDAPPAATDPALDGPSTVTESPASIPGEGTDRTLPATVFKPSDAGARPLVVISPGYQLSRTQYTSYARHFATWGFVVVLTDYADDGFFPDHDDLAADVPKVIDWALAQTSFTIDATKIALAGHSLGGKISVYAASLDNRVKAVVGWDPVDSNNPSVAPERMGNLTAAIAVIGETTNATGGAMPCAPGPDNFTTFYAASPSPAFSMTVVGADHMDWVDDPTCTFCTFCTDGSASNEVARRLTRRIDIAWLRRRLFADTSMDVWLAAPTDGTATVVTK